MTQKLPVAHSAAASSTRPETADPRYSIRSARASDLGGLAEIERSAARLLAGHAPDPVLRETTSLMDFIRATADGLLWIAALDERPVGFAHVKLLERGNAHLDELDVHPEHGRRGVGRRLVQAVCDWAAAAGMEYVTLSTFRDVRWNMPFYASIGFEIVPIADRSEAMRRIVDDEQRRGLDVSRRVIMRRESSV